MPLRFYISALQPLVPGDYTYAMNYQIRSFADPLGLVEPARRQIAIANPEIRVIFASSLEELISDRTLRDSVLARLAIGAGALAMLITCFGLYAVLSYSVARRTAEIGVRIALGAEPGQITLAIVAEALLVAAAGLAIGIPVALALSSLVKSQIFGLGAADPATLFLVALALILTTVGSALAPARRAAAVDPICALRCD